MSPSEHLAPDRALFLLALEADDPERVAAFAHTETCELCRGLLAEGQVMLRLLDDERGRLAREPVELGALEARVLAAITDPQLGAAVAPPRAAGRWAGLGLGLGLGALVAALLVWLDYDPAQTSHVHFAIDDCLLVEQVLALGAFGVGALAARSYATRLTPGQGALAAMSGALLGQALLMRICGHPGALWHLLLSHVAGVAVATVLGGLLPWAWLRARAPSR